MSPLNRKIIFSIVLSILFSSSFQILHCSPSVLIQTEVDPKEIYIGDPIQYRVTVTFSSTVTPMPLKVDKAWGEFETLDIRTLPIASIKDGKSTLRHILTFTTFSTGTLTLPGLPLTFSSQDTSLSEARTENIQIHVKSLLEEKGDEGNLRPLKGLFNFPSYLWVWIMLSILGLIALIYAIVRWRKSHKNITTQPLAPLRPPEEVALESLQSLENAELLTPEQFKDYYLRLSVICREYLERRYTMTAMEKTTSELMNEFRAMSLGLAVTNIVRELFENSDLVKFAKFLPKAEEAKQDLDRARRLIAMTTPSQTISNSQEKIPI